MNVTSIDFLDLRAQARQSVVRRAVAFSVALHVLLTVCVGYYWQGGAVRPERGECDVLIEFTTEAGPAAAEGSVAPDAVMTAQPPVSEKPAEPEIATAPPMPAEQPAVASITSVTSPTGSAPEAAPMVAMQSAHATSPAAFNREQTKTESSTQATAERNGVPSKPGMLANPLYLKNPEPAYPLAARRRRQEGVVLLSVHVTVQGRAARVALKQSSGFTLLDEAAAGAVMGWEFEPARSGTQAVESEIEVPVRFRLAK